MNNPAPRTHPDDIPAGEDGERWHMLASGNVALSYPATDGSHVVTAIYDGHDFAERYGW